MRPPLRTLGASLLLGVPLGLAVLGPALTGDATSRGLPFAPDGPLGTDFVGRDVLHQVLLGGRSVVLVAVAATLLAYLVGVPVGLLAATTRRRWVDEILMRPLDLVLAVPSLLLLILVAAVARPGPATLVGVVALIALPEIARVTRAAALPLAHGPAMEAMRLHRETWWRRAGGYVGRGVRRLLLADAGVRFVGAVYLVATASFLGVGVAPDAADWAVMVDRNRTGLFLQPWAVVVPAALVVALAVGVNLVADQVLAARADPGTPPGDAGPPARGARPPRRDRRPGPQAPEADRRPPPGGPLLRVRRLTATAGQRRLVDGVSFDLAAGEILAIVGASGSGKTTTGRALLGETTPGVRLTGGIALAGSAAAAGAPPPAGTVGYVPQQPAVALHPLRRVGAVLGEIARRHPPGRTRRARRQAVAEVLDRMALPTDRRFLRRFPHQLSGGQQQRLVIAHALLSRAVLLVADEPTTGQDALTRRDVARELTALARHGMAVVLLSHDLPLVRAVADRVLVLRHGTAVAQGPTAEVLAARDHHDRKRAPVPPTRGPAADSRRAGSTRCSPGRDVPPLLAVAGLVATHRHGGRRRTVLRDVGATAAAGECLAVVGRSGSGKTTLARCVAGLHPPTGGRVALAGRRLDPHLDRRDRRDLAAVQYVFQDARASFDAYRPVLDQVARAARRLRDATDAEARRTALRLLDQVGLAEHTVAGTPDRLSGGELHRAALARALAGEPRVLICDEITAGLDGDARERVLALLDDLRRRRDLALVVISHDRDVVARLADRIVVLDGGRVVEQGRAEALLGAARHPLTRALLPAAPERRERDDEERRADPTAATR
ncbi:ATP-binding cassette domain-containing protein [Micromonospora sp. NPDC002717]|uniref:ABC transporter ATP-binding protein/permease n=1 Tax=Micromonospora sp. NPDC002717 TaxID=3154424 RepID=UPI003321214F